MTTLPLLYSRDAKGKIRQWSVTTVGAMVIMAYGLMGGKQKEEKYRAEPKNVGRANWTSPEKQAELEAAAAWQKKRDEGYDTDPAKALAVEVLLPMLAHRFDKHEKKVKFPLDVQRKYNGIRCLALVGRDNKTTLISRQGKMLIAPHISGYIENGFGLDGDLFDGELYCYGLPLQTIVSLAKDNRPESLKLFYYIYDMPKVAGQPALPWSERRKHLEARFFSNNRVTASFGPKVVPPGASVVHGSLAQAETLTVNDMSEVTDFERVSVTAGFEGIMMRDLGAEYRLNVRSTGLLKLKRFQDAEFEIVGFEGRELSGNEEILSAFIFKNNLNEKTFKAVPIGTHEQKRKMWEENESYLGRRMTVRFLERSVDGVPIGNPVGIGFKDPTETDPEDEDDKMWSNSAE